MKKPVLLMMFVFTLTSISFGQTPSTEKGWFDLGFKQREEYKFAESVNSFNECLKLNPKSTPCLGLRGKSYWNLSKYDLAKKDFDQAIQIRPNIHLLYQYRGEYLYSWRNREQTDAAIADFTKAIQLKPDFAPAYLARGECYAFNHENDLAIADVTKALELNPNLTAAKVVLDRIRSQKSSGPVYQPRTVQSAAPSLTEAEKKKRAEDLYSSGIFNFRGDKFEAAAADFTEYLKIYPNSAEVYFNRGVTYRKWGKSDRAIVDFELALRLKPDLIQAKTELDKLKQAKTEDIITSISQITDVKPTDEFYGDLQLLIEKYGISKVAKDKKFNPQRPLTMPEYADFLKQGKEFLKNSASGFGTIEIDEEKLFNSKCTLPYLGMIPEKEIARSLSCNYRIKNFSMPGGENWVTRGKFAIYFAKALRQASLEYLLNTQSNAISGELFQQPTEKTDKKVITNAKAQPVTSISQITDVKPTDDFYSDLQVLIEKYGFEALTANFKFNPTRTLTKTEYTKIAAEGLGILKRIASRQIPASKVGKLFGSNCPMTKRNVLTETDIADSLGCLYGIGKLSVTAADKPITRAKLAVFLKYAFEDAILEINDFEDTKL